MLTTRARSRTPTLDEYGRDLTELFNYLTTGYKPRRKYQKLLVAPKMLKTALLEKIQRDTERDYFLSADEAKDYGLVDQVISQRA